MHTYLLDFHLQARPRLAGSVTKAVAITAFIALILIVATGCDDGILAGAVEGTYGGGGARSLISIDLKEDSFSAVTVASAAPSAALRTASLSAENANGSNVGAPWMITMSGEVEVTGGKVRATIDVIERDGRNLNLAESCPERSIVSDADDAAQDLADAVLACRARIEGRTYAPITVAPTKPSEEIVGTWKNVYEGWSGLSGRDGDRVTVTSHMKIDSSSVTITVASSPRRPINLDSNEYYYSPEGEIVIDIEDIDDTEISGVWRSLRLRVNVEEFVTLPPEFVGTAVPIPYAYSDDRIAMPEEVFAIRTIWEKVDE